MSVLVVVTTADEAAPLLRWGFRFARARGVRLLALHPARSAKAQPGQDLPLDDPEDAHPVRQAIRAALAEVRSWEPEAQVLLRGAAAPDPLEAVLNELREGQAELLVVGKHERLSPGEQVVDLSMRLLEQAPCDALLLRASGTSGQRCERVLVPAAGGPHAQVALGIGQGLTRAGAALTPLYVEPAAGELAREVGQRELDGILARAGVPANDRVEPRVVLADSPAAGIATVAQEGFDLVLVGATNQGFIRRLLFRTVPEHLLSGPEASAVAVVRRMSPLGARVARAAEDLLARWFPQLERSDRLALFHRLQTGSRFDVDFMALLSLATAIASFGLLQNSGAVVIGAMLVAPLMTPMIGAGLALVQGNVVLVKDAAASILKGFCLALVIGVLTGLLLGGWKMPSGALTAQLLARGNPDLTDLLVAFLSGLAAAYTLARPNLSSALPGVAIAAALVPPIATVGIALAMGHHETARGAALLFGTNLVAIVLGAAATFRIVGVRPSKEELRGRLWVRRALLGLVLAMLVLAVPLVSVLAGALTPPDDPSRPLRVDEALAAAIERRVEEVPGLTLLGISPSRTRPELEVLVAARAAVAPGLARDLAAIAGEHAGRVVRVDLVRVVTERTR